MSKTKTLFLAVLVFAAAFSLLMPVTASAASCSNTLVADVTSDDLTSATAGLPRVEDLLFRSEETHPMFSGYTKTRFPYVFFSRYRKEYVNGTPLSRDRYYLDRNNNAVYIREVPELGLTAVFWKQRDDTAPTLLTPWYESMTAIRLSDGSLLVGKSSELEARANDKHLISAIEVVGCVGGKATVLRSIPLSSPVRFEKNVYGYGGLDCEILKRN